MSTPAAPASVSFSASFSTNALRLESSPKAKASTASGTLSSPLRFESTGINFHFPSEANSSNAESSSLVMSPEGSMRVSHSGQTWVRRCWFFLKDSREALSCPAVKPATIGVASLVVGGAGCLSARRPALRRERTRSAVAIAGAGFLENAWSCPLTPSKDTG